MTPFQEHEPSEFAMDLVILACTLPDLPSLSLVCGLSSASFESSAVPNPFPAPPQPAVTHPPSSWLPPSPPSRHLTPSNSGNAECLVVWSLGSIWDAATPILLFYPPSISFLLIDSPPPRIPSLPLSWEGYPCLSSEVSFCCREFPTKFLPVPSAAVRCLCTGHG